MGTLVNGVYEPALGETGWGTAVNTNFDAWAKSAINALLYLKGDGTTESSSQIDALRTAALGGGGVGRRVYFPAGIFAFPDSKSFGDLTNQMQVIGAGRRQTFITMKNAHVFTGTAPDNAVVRDIHFSMRSGSTTGGGVKFDSASSCWISDVEVESVSTCTEPGIWLKGTVGSHIEHVQSGGATASGIRLDAAGATLGFCNANSVYRSRVSSVQGSTTPAIYGAAGGNRYRDNIIEANRGYGIQLDGAVADRISGNWFEDNSNHNIYVSNNTIQCVISENKFHYNHGDVGTATHITLAGTAGGRHANQILANQFQDGTTSGVGINIGAGVEFTSVIGNRGTGVLNATNPITNNGSYTIITGNDSGTTRYDNQVLPLTVGAGGQIAAGTGGTFTVKGDTQTGDNGDVTATGLFAIVDAAGDEVIGVTRKGYQVFKTPNGDPGSGQLSTNAFLFYWDNAAGKVMVRYRNNSGTETTAALF